MDSSTQWYYSEGTQSFGPFTPDQIIALVQSRLLNGDHLVVPEGSDDWKQVSASPFAGFLPTPLAPRTPARPDTPGFRVPIGRPSQLRALSPSTTHPTVVLPAVRTKRIPMWMPVLAVLAVAATGAWLGLKRKSNPLTSTATTAPSSSSAPLPVPLGRFTFDGPDPKGARIRNAIQHDGVVELDGTAPNDGGPESRNADVTLKTPDLNPQNLTVAVRLMPDDISGRNSNLLVAGAVPRWLALEVSPAGQLTLSMNQHAFQHAVPGVKVKTGEWIVLAVTLDVSARKAAVYVNGGTAAQIALPSGFKLNLPANEREWWARCREWTFADQSSGNRFKGAVDELVVFAEALSPDQVARLKLGGSSPISSRPPELLPVKIETRFMSKGAYEKTQANRPQLRSLSSGQPASISKLPQGLSAPKFAEIKMSAAAGARIHALVLDGAGTDRQRLFVDSNANGDLTDDPPARWEPHRFSKPDGRDALTFQGEFQIELKSGAEKRTGVLIAYSLDVFDPKTDHNAIWFYSDYCVTGSIRLDGKSVAVLLTDDECQGDFSNPLNIVCIDMNGDGRFGGSLDYDIEMFLTRDQFNLGGVPCEIADVASDGSGFRIVRSSRTPPKR